MEFNRNKVVLSFVALFFVFQKNVEAQSEGIKPDSLLSPAFYSMAPKLFNFSCTYIPKYKLQYSDGAQSLDYFYKHEFINTFCLQLPVLINKNGWYLNGLISYYNYKYKIEIDGNTENKNYTSFSWGVRAVKRFEFENRKWIWGNVLSVKGEKSINLKSFGYVLSLSTPIKLKNSGNLMAGIIFIFNKDIKVPALPLLNYSTWLSKKRGLLFTGKFPLLEASVTKIIRNDFFIKGGFNLLNNAHYITPTDYPFLGNSSDYELKRLNISPNLKIEKTLYKSFWVIGEAGYLINFRSGINNHDNQLHSDIDGSGNSPYFNVGLFYRPVTNKWK